MVGASGHRPHHAFHLQGKEQGGDLSDGETSLGCYHIELEVIGTLQCLNNALLVVRQVGKELSLHGLWPLRPICPPH